MHNFFKITALAIAAASAVFFASGCSAEHSQTTQEAAASEKFPAFKTADLKGHEVTQDIFKGKKVTVINIWGTFCPPCIGEMPELGAWAKEMPQDAQLIGLVCDASGPEDKEITAAALKILSDSQADFVNLLPSQELMKYLDKVEAVPTTIFVDEEGRIIGEQVVGANVPKYKELLARYLK